MGRVVARFSATGALGENDAATVRGLAARVRGGRGSSGPGSRSFAAIADDYWNTKEAERGG